MFSYGGLVECDEILILLNFATMNYILYFFNDSIIILYLATFGILVTCPLVQFTSLISGLLYSLVVRGSFANYNYYYLLMDYCIHKVKCLQVILLKSKFYCIHICASGWSKQSISFKASFSSFSSWIAFINFQELISFTM